MITNLEAKYVNNNVLVFHYDYVFCLKTLNPVKLSVFTDKFWLSLQFNKTLLYPMFFLLKMFDSFLLIQSGLIHVWVTMAKNGILLIPLRFYWHYSPWEPLVNSNRTIHRDSWYNCKQISRRKSNFYLHEDRNSTRGGLRVRYLLSALLFGTTGN